MVDTGLCKNVKIRFENFLRLLKPSDVAAAIVSAQRRGIDELTVPRKTFLVSFYVVKAKITKTESQKLKTFNQEFLSIWMIQLMNDLESWYSSCCVFSVLTMMVTIYAITYVSDSYVT